MAESGPPGPALSTQALDRLAEGVLLVDADGRVVYANAAAGTLFRRPAGDLIGETFSVPMRTAVPVEITVPAAAGEPAIAEMQVVPLDHGDRGLSLVSLHDVTDLRATRRSLEAEQKALTETNRNLQEFAYAISHDLQEPLRMVTGYLSLLTRRSGDRLDGEGREFVTIAMEGATRMRQMILGLLEFSRVSTHGGDPMAVDAGEALDGALANLRTVIAEAGAAVTVDRPLPRVEADAVQLSRVFQNLIDNAVKYRATDRPPRVHVGARSGAGVVTFSVSDNGIGIAPDHRDEIFVVFRRLHGSGTYGGTGVGLAVVKRIVERLGGRIWVEGAPGEGTVFRFTLPAADVAPQVAGAEAAAG